LEALLHRDEERLAGFAWKTAHSLGQRGYCGAMSPEVRDRS
jgi:hypothetical protein